MSQSCMERCSVVKETSLRTRRVARTDSTNAVMIAAGKKIVR